MLCLVVGKKGLRLLRVILLAVFLFSKAPDQKMWDDPFFAYIGETGLTIKGNITGHVYRFHFKGDQQLIDYRDAAAMAAVPVLKKLMIK